MWRSSSDRVLQRERQVLDGCLQAFHKMEHAREVLIQLSPGGAGHCPCSGRWLLALAPLCSDPSTAMFHRREAVVDVFCSGLTLSKASVSPSTRSASIGSVVTARGCKPAGTALKVAVRRASSPAWRS